MRDYKVLHGFFGNAGQPGILARELRKLGVEADSMIVGGNKFAYETDHRYEERTDENFRRLVVEKFPLYDIIHIHALTPFRTKQTCQFPMGIDLLTAKAMGKRVIIHYRGSEIRSPSAFAAATPYNYVTENPKGIFDTFNDRWVSSYIRMGQALADEVLAIDPELQTYAPHAKILPRAIDLDKWRYVGLKNHDRPLIVHAPSREAIKGTPSVLAAVAKLQSEGLAFDFRLIQGLPNDEARAVYEQADIIVDQLRIGWYGVLAVESMALGKCVVSYVRDDLLSFFGGQEPPIAVANPDTIADVLRDLIINPKLRQQQAERGHKFCREYHDSSAVAAKCVALYDEIMAREPQFDVAAYMGLVTEQEAEITATMQRAKQAGVLKGKQKARDEFAAAARQAKEKAGKTTAAVIEQVLRATQPEPLTFRDKALKLWANEGAKGFIRVAALKVARR